MDNLYFTTSGKTGYQVFYKPGMDGGGTWFGQEYADVIKELYRNRVFSNCLEWCAGPGYIGFNLLDHGLCKNLSLLEIHTPTAEQAIKSKHSIFNGCANAVTVYNAGSVAAIDPTTKFDLVVGNPPHFPNASDDPDVSRIESDPDWAVHADFFKNIKTRLAPDGVILLQENMIGSTPSVFEPYINANNLRINSWFKSKNWFDYPDELCKIYYIEIVHA